MIIVYTINMVRELARIKAPGDELTVFTPYPKAFEGMDVKITGLSENH